jgi:hypothetical protein
LLRNPAAPASTPATRADSSSDAVMMITLVVGLASLIRRVASKPFI